MILALALVAALAVAALLRRRARRGAPGGDLPSRVVAAAAGTLPRHRRAWGRAMVAELRAVRGGAQRCRFAGAAVRVALFPPASREGAVRTAAAAGLTATAATTLAAARFAPTLPVFVAALGLLLTGCATVLIGRWHGLPVGRGARVAGVLAGTGVLAATSAVVATAIGHPEATRDPSHVASLALAAILAGYAVAGAATLAAAGTPRTARWAGVAGAVVAAAAGAALDIHESAGVVSLISPVAAAATVGAALTVAAGTGSRAAGRRAGLLTAVLGAPMQFAAAVLLSRAPAPELGGDIVRLAVAPVALCALAALAVTVVPRPGTVSLYR